MTETALVHRYGRHFAFDAEVTAIVWVDDVATVALGDGSVRRVSRESELGEARMHDGAILTACRHPDGVSVVTGGDDGRVRRLRPDGEIDDLGRFGGKWVEHLIASPASGLLVAGVGRDAVVWTQGAVEPSHRYAFKSTSGGLALDAKGKRLAVAHYGGASLLYASNAESGRIELQWIGSHLACTMSGDGRYLLTALQETGLHGWQLPGMHDMKMSGYAAKTRSFSWSRRDRWCATGGDARVILWPFEGKTGPMGKAPLMRAERKDASVTRVAFRPLDEVLAVGYSDGAVVLARLADEGVIDLDEPGGAITALTWNDAGTRLAWGDEDGRVGLIDMATRA